MPRPSNREKILTEGLRVVQTQGFAGASVRDIAQAAHVPLGSFTNHFPSKEAFGLEILERYHEQNRQLTEHTLRDKSMSVRERFRVFFDELILGLNCDEMRGGCLVGNFCAEVANHSEQLRLRLVEVFRDMRMAIAEALEEGVASGELKGGYDCEDLAGFIYSSLQGAILISKVVRQPGPLERCRDKVLRFMVV